MAKSFNTTAVCIPEKHYIEDNFPLESSFPLCYTDNGFCFKLHNINYVKQKGNVW